MKTVSIHDAKTNLSKYIAAVKAGEEIYIGSFGKPEVKLELIPVVQPTQRQFGIGKGKLQASPNAFSEATEAEVTALMYGSGK